VDSLSNNNAAAQQAPNFQQPFLLAGPEAEENSGFDFWGVLNRRKWLVFLGLITGMALGSVFHAKSETVFESKANVWIEPKKRLIVPMTNSGEILRNYEDTNIRHDKKMNQENIILGMLKNNEGLNNLRSLKDLSDEEKFLYISNNLTVAQNRDEPFLFHVNYFNSHETDAQIILANLIETYKKSLKDEYEKETDDTLARLDEFDRGFRQDFKREQEKLAKLIEERTANFTMFGQGLTESHAMLKKVSESLETTRAELTTLAEDRDRILAAQATGPEGIRQTVWIFQTEGKMAKPGQYMDLSERMESRMSEQIMKYEEEWYLMKQRLADGHPTVKMARARLDRAKADYQDMIEGNSDKTSVTRPMTDEESLVSYLELVTSRIESLQQELNYNVEAKILHTEETKKLAMLESKIELQKEATEEVKKYLNTITAKLVEIKPSSNSDSNQEGFRVQMLSEASLGEVVWPILPLILGAGGLLGSLAGFGLGCLVELADKTFHNPDEVMKQLQIPLIGHIPVIGQGKRYLVEGSAIEPIICTYHRPKSQTSEAFRAVRTALYFNTQGKQHSVIQVTSPTPGDGKSTLASNLAVSIAQSGKRVLLVDADMRRPRQHATFGIEANEGFATVLSGRSAWRDCMYECEEIEGLTLMPCGSKPQNPAELCSSPQVKTLIEELREEFDFVIIDTPPLLAVTDACPIAARVDGVILTLRIKKNVRVSAERACEMLRNLGANCLGLVVNGVGAQSGYGSQYTYGAYRAGYSYNGYGQGYGYGYGYGYGNGGKYYDEDQKGRKVTPKAIETEASIES